MVADQSPERRHRPTGCPDGRVLGVDVARALALLAMALTHLNATTDVDGRATAVGTVASGRASALFAVLLGVSAALMTSRQVGAGQFREAATALAVRALIIVALGLTLVALLDGTPAVILTQYGLLLFLAVPFLRLRPRTLLVLAATWAVLSPVLSHAIRAGRPPTQALQPDLAMLATPVRLLDVVVVTGFYPVLTWLTYLFVGLAVGRLDLRAPLVRRRLIIGGTLLSAGSHALSAAALALTAPAVASVELHRQRAGTAPADDWRWLLVDARHTGTTLDLLQTTGSALAVLGVCLVLADRSGVPGQVLARTGSLSLSLYTTHIVAAGTVGPFGLTAWLCQAVIALGAGVVASRLRRRGPLEAFVSAAARAATA